MRIPGKKHLILLTGAVAAVLVVAAVVLLVVFLPGGTRGGAHTGKMWDENRAVFEKIMDLPFNREVAAGTLDDRVFRDYIIQDYFYLQAFRKAYEVLLAKAPDARGKELAAEAVKAIDSEEEDVHKKYFEKYGVTAGDLASTLPNRTTRAYASFLMDTVEREPFEVGLAATLPCHWVYYEVGSEMKKKEEAGGNKYGEWIEEYGSGSWEESDAKVFVDAVERYMEKAPAETRKKMERAFSRAFKLEYEFWDTVYRESKSLSDDRIVVVTGAA